MGLSRARCLTKMKFLIFLIYLIRVSNLMIIDQKSSESDTWDNFVNSDEYSGDIPREENIQHRFVIKFDISLSPKDFLLEFDVSLAGNFIVQKADGMKALREAFQNYISDLLVKHGFGNLKIITKNVQLETVRGLKMNATNAKCQNEPAGRTKTAKECEAIAEIIRVSFNVNEFLVYFHEIGYTENVNLIGKPRLKFV